MAVSKKRTTKKATPAKAKTKPFRQSTETGKIVSKAAVKENPAETVTQEVAQDNDGVRSDKGGTHKVRAIIQSRTPLNDDPTGEVVGGRILSEEVILDSTEGTNWALPLADDKTPSKDAQSDVEAVPAPEQKPCLTDRPNKPRGYTCLDEMREAVEKPQNYTEGQLNAIYNEDNLCANCKETLYPISE